MSSFSLEIVSW